MHGKRNLFKYKKLFLHSLLENIKEIELNIQLICEKCVMNQLFTLCVQGIVYLSQKKFKFFWR
jgi:hypothetical protein